MGLVWSKDLSVGVPEIDRQHQELIRRIDALISAMSQGGGEENCSELISFLEKYVVEHVAAEESFMRRFSYAALALHRQEHQAFLRVFQDYQKRYQAEGNTPLLQIQLQRWVHAWLRQHIRTVDKALGAFLMKKLSLSAETGLNLSEAAVRFQISLSWLPPGFSLNCYPEAQFGRRQ